MIRLRVAGDPVAQGNHRVNAHGATYETTKGHQAWRDNVTWQARALLARLRQAGPAGAGELDRIAAGAPVAVAMVFLLARPKGHYGTGRNADTVRPSAPACPAGKPDLSKLVRAVEDALTVARLWRDDSQVVALNVAKVWAGGGQPPGVLIEIEESKP